MGARNSIVELSKTTSQFIGGHFEDGKGTKFIVENPSNEDVVAEINGCSTDQVERAIKAARKAAPGWEATPAAERAAILRKFVAAMQEQIVDLEGALVAEAGYPNSPIAMVQFIAAVQSKIPFKAALETIDLFLTLPDIYDNPLPLRERVNPLMNKQVSSFMRYTPVGVVAAIAAYNYPFFTAMWKVAPALIAGNTVILRPSPLTPISSLVFATAAQKAGLPEGVLSVIMESTIEGAHLLTTHHDVNMVTFTGSTAVGKAVMAQGAPTMKRLQLELGGKSAQIFLPDGAEMAAGAAAGVCLAHSGQGCVLGTRVFVPEDKKAMVLEGMKASFANVKIGEATDPTTMMGPLISRAQVERCERFVGLAVDAGAKVVTGGKRPAHMKKGFYFEPTVLDTPDNNNPAAREEIFGPVVSVIGYKDLDHAVEMANDTDFGLSGYVNGVDKAKCLEIALRLKTGAVNINGGAASSYVSGGGHKHSGVGRERGIEGLRLYQEVTVINMVS